MTVARQAESAPCEFGCGYDDDPSNVRPGYVVVAGCPVHDREGVAAELEAASAVAAATPRERQAENAPIEELLIAVARAGPFVDSPERKAAWDEIKRRDAALTAIREHNETSVSADADRLLPPCEFCGTTDNLGTAMLHGPLRGTRDGDLHPHWGAPFLCCYECFDERCGKRGKDDHWVRLPYPLTQLYTTRITVTTGSSNATAASEQTDE